MAKELIVIVLKGETAFMALQLLMGPLFSLLVVHVCIWSSGGMILMGNQTI